jgi:malate synthase
VSVALQYLDSWFGGNGAAAINNLMEDAATAEISRSQLWQWRVTGTALDDGRPAGPELYRQVRDEELGRLGEGAYGRLGMAAELLDALVLTDDFDEYLTLRAYPRLGSLD